MDRVRYSALHTPMQSSTGPPGEWGSRASAMSHTILQTTRQSQRYACITCFSMFPTMFLSMFASTG